MTDLILQYGLLLVFTNVLLERTGLPLPAMPTLMVAGSLVATGSMSAAMVFGVAFLGCIIGDTLWYAAGWRYGRRVMSLLCRISLSPDSCVRETERSFERWGAFTLIIAKFIPGMSTVVRPLAGSMHQRWWTFELLNGIGTALWVGAAIGVGVLFHAQINEVLILLRDYGALALQILAVLVAIFVAIKWWQRRRFYKTLRVARITVDELRKRMSGEPEPVVVDVRSKMSRDQDGRCIPGARVMTIDEVVQRLEHFPRDCDVVFYCACPNEASAAVAAQKLIDRGYLRVHALLGGIDAWALAGYEIEDRAAAAPIGPMALG
jgi:membrane protein DedA with SNARE-associated domain/rhodanese-related sulfurtransferase